MFKGSLVSARCSLRSVAGPARSSYVTAYEIDGSQGPVCLSGSVSGLSKARGWLENKEQYFE